MEGEAVKISLKTWLMASPLLIAGVLVVWLLVPLHPARPNPSKVIDRFVCYKLLPGGNYEYALCPADPPLYVSIKPSDAEKAYTYADVTYDTTVPGNLTISSKSKIICECKTDLKTKLLYDCTLENGATWDDVMNVWAQ